MSDDVASDWLSVAYAETRDMPDGAFLRGCEAARRECSYHGQIIPTIRKANAEMDEFIRKMDAISVPFLAQYSGGSPHKALSDSSETQRLIEQTARSLKP